MKVLSIRNLFTFYKYILKPELIFIFIFINASINFKYIDLANLSQIN